MPAIRRFKVEKLIRDRLPEIMRAQGITAFPRILTDGEYVAQLKLKIVEEAQEASAARDADELLWELADVMEVVRALAAATGLSLENIERARLEKRERRGGFDARVYNTAVDIPADCPQLSYYTDRPDAYPEISPAPH